MVTVTINENSKQAKAIIAMLRTFSFVKFKEKKEEQVHYNPEFVKMVKESNETSKRYRVDSVDDLWESL